MHGEVIRHQVKNMCRLDDNIVRRFRQVVRFDIGGHHLKMQLHQDQQCQSLSTKFIMTEEEVEEIVDD